MSIDVTCIHRDGNDDDQDATGGEAITCAVHANTCLRMCYALK